MTKSAYVATTIVPDSMHVCEVYYAANWLALLHNLGCQAALYHNIGTTVCQACLLQLVVRGTRRTNQKRKFAWSPESAVGF